MVHSPQAAHTHREAGPAVLVEALTAARDEIIWWGEEHGCCHGRSTVLLTKIDALLGRYATA